MENEVVSNSYLDSNNKMLNENLIKKENNTNKQQNDSQIDKLEKTKELLKQLLKQTLDNKLLLIEKKSRNHFATINVTLELTKAIKNEAIKMGKQIEQKMKKDKEKQSKIKQNKNGKNKKKFSPRKSAISFIFNNRSKTPLHKNNNNRDKTTTPTPVAHKKEKDLFRSKSNLMLVKSLNVIETNKHSRRNNIRGKSIGSKSKTNINDNNLEDLHNYSVASIKTNYNNNLSNKKPYSKIGIYKNSSKILKKKADSNSKNNLNKSKDSKKSIPKKNSLNCSEKNLIHYNKKKRIINNIENTDEKKKRKNTPFKKKINGDNNSVQRMIDIKSKGESIEDEIDEILFMENKLKKDTGIDNNDPLLILPLKDLDFIPKSLLRKSSTRNDSITTYQERKYCINSFKIEENFEKIKFNNILKYLSLNELIPIKNISKKFHKIIILYFIEYLEGDKKSLINIKNNLNVTGNSKRENISNMSLSKGSKKAVELLNESQLNHLFKEDKFPINDIILVYRIYFQMINHPCALIAKNNLDKFWEQCKYYFSNEQNGKTGDILISMINKNKIDINGNNLYQIYNLVKENPNKILPNYFSKICGTTGLFAFIIKDILDFLGISPKIKNKENAFWTYSDIIDSINEKINYLKNYKI